MQCFGSRWVFQVPFYCLLSCEVRLTTSSFHTQAGSLCPFLAGSVLFSGDGTTNCWKDSGAIGSGANSLTSSGRSGEGDKDLSSHRKPENNMVHNQSVGVLRSRELNLLQKIARSLIVSRYQVTTACTQPARFADSP